MISHPRSFIIHIKVEDFFLFVAKTAFFRDFCKDLFQAERFFSRILF